MQHVQPVSRAADGSVRGFVVGDGGWIYRLLPGNLRDEVLVHYAAIGQSTGIFPEREMQADTERRALARSELGRRLAMESE